MKDTREATTSSKTIKNRNEFKIPPRNPRWNSWQAFFVLLIITLIQYFAGWTQLPHDLDLLIGFTRFVMVGLGEYLLYIIVILTFLRLIKRPIRELGFVKPRLGGLLLGLMTGIMLFVVVGLLGGLLSQWLGQPAPQSFTLAIAGAHSTWQMIVLLILGCVLVPIKEEAFYRGLLYPTMRKSYGIGKGIVITALIFTGMHFDPLRGILLLIGGLVLTWLYEKTSSIWPSIVAHGTWNLIMALALWLQKI